MASTTENLSALSGDLKTVYGSELVQVLPDAAILQKRFKLADSAAFPLVGDYFSALVGLQLPWGFSFLGNGTEGTSTNESLGDALAGQTKPAQVHACYTVLADNVSYFVLDRAVNNSSAQSVLSAMTYTGRQMALSARNVLELTTLHGQEGLGAASGAINTLTVTLDPATTSAGILSVLVGARLQWMQSNLTSARTANDGSNYLTVSSVDISDPANPTITMVATGTTNVASITTGDVMFIAGSRGISVGSSDTSVPFYEQIGIGSQLATTSGTVFSIDKANIGWKANQLSSIGPFTPSVLMQAAALVMSRGGELGKHIAVVSPKAWGVLNAALATSEIYMDGAGSMSKKSGTDEIEIKSGGITVEVMPHPFQKDGKFYLFPESQFHRIGSIDLSFEMPGTQGEYFFPVAQKAVVQRQCRADWQVFLQKPPSCVVGTGITY